MAKNTDNPGRFSQIWQIWKLTAETDKKALPIAIGGGLGALLISIVLGFVGGGSTLGLIIWIVLGVVGGAVTFSSLLSRRAEAVAFGRIQGQPGAVGAILGTVLKRGWSGSEEPVSVNPRTQDLVYRLSGRGGIVIIAEGHRSSVSKLVEEEKRRLGNIASGVPTTVLWVCNDEHSISLKQIRPTIFKLKRVVRTGELGEINKRLSTMRMNVPVPKGIDPTKVRGMSKPR